MNLLSCRVRGFGKLAGLQFEFATGFNLVFARNEGGKTTLMHFLIGTLYGQLRPGIPNQRRLEDWVELYSPWNAEAYGGVLRCGLADGREVEIERAFGKDEDAVEVRRTSGEIITSQYERQKNGEVLFARSHLGLSKELFESVAVIREHRVDGLDGGSSVQARIANLALTGDEDLSAQRALAALQDVLNGIGSERAPTRPLRQAQDVCRTLETEKKLLEARSLEAAKWLEERKQYEGRIEALELELAGVGGVVAAARLKEARDTLSRLEALQPELDAMRERLARSGDVADFPAQGLDHLNQLLGMRSGMQENLHTVQADRLAAEAAFREAEEKRKTAPFRNAPADCRPEHLSELLHQFRALSRQKQSEAETVFRLNAEHDRVTRELASLGSVVTSGAEDRVDEVRGAAESARNSALRALELTQKISAQKPAIRAHQVSSTRCRSAAASLFLLAFLLLLPFAAARLPNIARLSAVALCVGGALILVQLGARRAKQGELARGETGLLEAELDRTGALVRESEDVLARALDQTGFKTPEEFLTAAAKAEPARQRAAQVERERQDRLSQQKRLEEQEAGAWEALAALLRSLGFDPVPETVESTVETAREQLRARSALDEASRDAQKKLSSLSGQETLLSGRFSAIEAEIAQILRTAGVESAEEFKRRCRERDEILRTREREKVLTREFHDLCRGADPDLWRTRVRDLENLTHGTAPAARLDLESLRDEQTRIERELAQARQEHARASERVESAFRGYRTAAAIDEDLAVAEQELRDLSLNRQALVFALEMATEQSGEQQRQLAPRLSEAMMPRFLRITGGRYSRVCVDSDFGISVFETSGEKKREAVRLSRGTQDQLYFALRFGLLDLIARKDEPCPCLLDEPFAVYDSARLLEALRIVSDESKRRQLVLFTCREELRDLARSFGAHTVELPS